MEKQGNIPPSILFAVSAFDISVLKRGSTCLTTSDGTVFKEDLDRNGTYCLKLVSSKKKAMRYLEKTSRQHPEISEPTIDVTPSHRFDVNDPTMVQYFREHGYVVVRGVANNDQVQVAKDLVWQFLESSSGWKPEDPSTWTTESFARIGMPNTGIINGAGIGQSQA